jgi:predicted esterase
MIGACTLALGALLTAPVSAEQPDVLLKAPLAELFGLAPTIGKPKLSPRGDQMLFLQQNELGVAVLQTLKFADGAVTTLLVGSEAGHDIVWCDFVNETKIFCDLRKGLPGLDPEYQRFFSVNTDGSDLTEFQRGTGCTASDPLRNTYYIDWLPEEPETIQFTCGGGSMRLDLDRRRIENLRGAGESGSGKQLYTDGRGNGHVYRGTIGNDINWYYREDPTSADWNQFDVTHPLEFETPIRPVGYGSDTGSLMHVGWNEATGTWALYSRTLGGDFADKLVITHPVLDLQLVDTIGRYERVVSVPYIDSRARRHIIDDRIKEVHAFISGKLPDLDIEVLDESWDGNIYLARAKSEVTVGEFIVVNMATQALQAIGPEYAHLAPYVMAPSELVEITGADGGTFFGQLTRPSGTVGAVPAVIIPRAAASHEDVADPNYLVQFLAASGYAVLRIENRAQLEVGGGWLPERSVSGWNQSADDVNDAAQFLVDLGITAPDRICGIGKNYGAYNTLMTAIKYPELLECVVSISGIADPRSSAGAQRVGGASALREEVLDEGSPIKRARDVQPPVLIFQGRNDPTVRMAAHAVTLSNDLKSAGNDVRFIEYIYDTHDIDRGPYRMDMLSRIGEFLTQHIGEATLAPAAEENTGG